tara:strand:- start:2114 stop:2665 length:552 start_codon:yes stop_codon:yes gene_type:complete
MNTQKIELPSDVSELQSMLKNAIEHYQGSPVKNQNKLNETTAIALGFKNYDSLSAELNKEELEPISAHYGNSPVVTTIINGTEIDDSIFEDELVGYKLEDRENLIDDLIMFISEGTRPSDLYLMKEDLAMLMQWEDEYIFSAIGTNDYVSPSKNTEEFNKICQDILEIQDSQDKHFREITEQE